MAESNPRFTRAAKPGILWGNCYGVWDTQGDCAASATDFTAVVADEMVESWNKAWDQKVAQDKAAGYRQGYDEYMKVVR